MVPVPYIRVYLKRYSSNIKIVAIPLRNKIAFVETFLCKGIRFFYKRLGHSGSAYRSEIQITWPKQKKNVFIFLIDKTQINVFI